MSALVPEKLSAIRRLLKYSIYGKRSWYIAHCPLYGSVRYSECPLNEVPLYTLANNTPTGTFLHTTGLDYIHTLYTLVYCACMYEGCVDTH